MSKNLGSKKKKGSSPDPGKSLPRIPRTPQKESPKGTTGAAMDFERFLSGMEGRLSAKIDSTNKAVGEAVSLAKQTNDALEALEEKVDSNKAAMQSAIEECEERMTEKFKTTVKDLVLDQLRTAGFDPKLYYGLFICRRGGRAR